MKRSRSAFEAEEEEPGQSDTSAVHDAGAFASAASPAQGWAELLGSILLGDSEPPQGLSDGAPPDDADNDTSAPLLGGDHETSDGQSLLEDVGNRIETWVDAAIHQRAEPETHDDGDSIMSIDKHETPGTDPLQCFGMIHHCRIRLHGVMEDLRRKLAHLRPSTSWARLEFEEASGTGFLRLDQNTLCAQLDHHLSAPLNNILQIESTVVLAYVPIDDLLATIDKARGKKMTESSVDLNVYGRASVRDVVGRMLSQDSLYLQRIKHCEEHVEYVNPHMLDYEVDEDERDHVYGITMLNSDERSKEDIERTIVEICSAETKNRHYREVEEDMHVTVDLLPHQKQAVPFMMEREIGPLDDRVKLWKPAENEQGPGFRHAITGHWTSEPRPEVGGGILADDPGMGKTLSTLALIGARRAAAQAWALSGNDGDTVNAKTTLRSKATLVVVPSLDIVKVWLGQVEEFMDRSVVFVKYHGRSRDNQLDNIADADVVVTTYHVLAVEHAERRKKRSPLHLCHWFRVVLDEAHYIRHRATTFYAAVMAIEACHRWCLTGTPIQNKLEDLGALLAFVRADPFNNTSVFRKHVVSRLSYDEEGGKERLSLLLSFFCMRRTIDRLDIPPSVEHRQFVELCEAERELYETTRDSMVWDLTHGTRTASSRSVTGKFEIQHVLRRLCNHGTFQSRRSPSDADLQAQKEDVFNSVGAGLDVVCSACYESFTALDTNYTAVRQCSHLLCDECVSELSGRTNSTASTETCLLCAVRRGSPQRPTITSFARVSGAPLRSHGVSSKMEQLMRDVSKGLEHTKR